MDKTNKNHSQLSMDFFAKPQHTERKGVNVFSFNDRQKERAQKLREETSAKIEAKAAKLGW